MNLLEDLCLLENAFKFLDNDVIDPHFLTNQVLGLVLRVVCVAESAVVADLELEEFVAESAMLVTDIVAEVELFAAGR